MPHNHQRPIFPGPEKPSSLASAFKLIKSIRGHIQTQGLYIYMLPRSLGYVILEPRNTEHKAWKLPCHPTLWRPERRCGIKETFILCMLDFPSNSTKALRKDQARSRSQQALVTCSFHFGNIIHQALC